MVVLRIGGADPTRGGLYRSATLKHTGGPSHPALQTVCKASPCATLEVVHSHHHGTHHAELLRPVLHHAVWDVDDADVPAVGDATTSAG